MSQPVGPFQVTSDHAEPVTIAGALSVTIKVIAGDPVYYGDSLPVNSVVNQGQIALNGQQLFTDQVWIRSAGVSAITLLFSPPEQVLTDLPNTLQPRQGSNVIESNQPVQQQAGGSSTQTQVLRLTGSPTSGTLKLSYRSSTTPALNWNSTAAQVEGQLNALNDVSADGGLICTGGPWPGTAITVSWNAALGVSGVVLPLITADTSSLLPITAGFTATPSTNIYQAGTTGFEVDQFGRVYMGSNPEIDRGSLGDSRTRFSHFLYDPATNRAYFQMAFLRMRANPVNIQGGRTGGVFPDTPGRAYLLNAITNNATSIALDPSNRGTITVSPGAAGFQGEFGSSGIRYAGIEDGANRAVVSYTGLSGNSLTGVTWVEESTPGQTYSTNAQVSDLLPAGTTLLITYGSADVGIPGWRDRAAQIAMKLSQNQPYAFSDTGGSGQFYQGGQMSFLTSSIGSKGFPSSRNEWVFLDERGYWLQIGGGKIDAAHSLRKFEVGGPQARIRVSQKVKAPGGLVADGSGTIASVPLRSLADWPASGGVRFDQPGGSVRGQYASLDVPNQALLNVTGLPANQALNDQIGAAYSWLTLPTSLPVGYLDNFDLYSSNGSITVNNNIASYSSLDRTNRLIQGLTWHKDQAATAVASTDTFTCNNHGFANGDTVKILDMVPATTGLTVATGYFVVGKTTNTFQVSLTPGGAAIDITADISSCLVRSFPTTPLTGQTVDGDYFVYSDGDFPTGVIGAGGPIVANDSYQNPRTRTMIGAGAGPNGEAGIAVGASGDVGWYRSGLAQAQWRGSLDVPNLTVSGAKVGSQPWMTVPAGAFVGVQFGSATTSGTYIFGSGGNKVALAGAGSAFGVLRLDPADFTAGGWSANVRIRAWVTCNTVDPAAGAWSFQLVPVSSYNGGSNVDPGIATVGATVASASVTPSVSTTVTTTGTPAAFPVAGNYALVVVLGSNTAANSIERVFCTLQVQRS